MQDSSQRRPGIERLLGLGSLVLLTVLCVYVVNPFASALIWAVVLGFTLYPMQRKMTEWFGGRNGWAALVVTLMAVIVVVGPLTLLGLSVVDDGKKLANSAREQVMNAPEEAPVWMRDVPLIGLELAEYWEAFIENRDGWQQRGDEPAAANQENDTSSKDPDSVAAKLVDGVRQFALWAAVVVGKGLTQLTISLFLVFFILRDAESLGGRLNVAIARIDGRRGMRLLKVAGQTVKGVVLGYLVTSAAQAVMACVGFAIAGVPGAVLLAALTFFLAVIPVGPPLIWGGAAVWLHMQERTGWSIFMVIWGLLAISSVDNVLRPLLVSQENKMPYALMFLGLIGGAVAFGLVGVFLGPVLLAVAFRLIDEWTSSRSLDKLGEEIS